MADKFLDKTGLTTVWDKIKTLLAGKVDKVTGKGLSTNDFTTAYKDKLDGLNNVTVDSALSSTSENPVQNKVINSALSGKADSSHTHTIAQVTNLQSSLDGKANSSHTHTKSQITDFPDIPSIGTISNSRIDTIIG